MNHRTSSWIKSKIREKERLLSVIAYFSNQRAHQEIQKIFYAHDIQCFYLYENFFFRPIHFSEVKREVLEKMTSTVPFLRRYIEPPHEMFIPDVNKIENLIQKSQILYDALFRDPPISPKTSKSLRAFLAKDLSRVDFWGEPMYGAKLLPLWRNVVNQKGNYEELTLRYSVPFWELSEFECYVGYEGSFDVDYIKTEYLTTIARSRNAQPLFIEFLVSDWRFLLSSAKNVHHVFISISTQEFMYGYIWIFWADGNNQKQELEEFRKNNTDLLKTIRESMIEIIKKHYLPSLIVFENSWEEKVLKDAIREGFKLAWEKPDAIRLQDRGAGNDRNHRDLPKSGSLPEDAIDLVFMKLQPKPQRRSERSGRPNELEKTFHDLWTRRWEKIKEKQDISGSLNKTLIFHKFFNSSHSMLQLLREISKLSPSKKRDFLPSVLVVGGPGSGKDTVSQLIRVFSRDYFDAPVYTINLASLKPPVVAPSMTMGTEFNLSHRDQYQVYGLIGFFERIIQNELSRGKTEIIEHGEQKYEITCRGDKKNGTQFVIEIRENGEEIITVDFQLPLDYLSLENLEERIKNEIDNSKNLKLSEKDLLRENIETGIVRKVLLVRAVVILDELNSLDIDTQGALLRFIENSELVRIGGVEPVFPKNLIDFLIIGVMNEDPEKLTKESVFKVMESGEIFGKLITEILYENFRKIRRLREDLYYRMIRGGKIEIPALDQRREDIPVLFYIFSSIEASHSGKELIVTFKAIDEVSNPALRWPGNVRQLQTVAKIAVRKALEKEKGDDKVVVMEEEDVRHALDEAGVL